MSGPSRPGGTAYLPASAAPRPAGDRRAAARLVT